MIMGVAMSIRGAPVEMRGQLCGTSSLCPPCGTLSNKSLYHLTGFCPSKIPPVFCCS